MTPARRRLVAAATVLLFLVGACTGGNDEPKLQPVPVDTSAPTTSTPSPTKQAKKDHQLERFYAQHLTWRDCRDGDRCATLTVPLDYSRLQGRTIKLSVLKVPATRTSQRIGAMVVNPGGPGGSGVDYAANSGSYFGVELRAAFDVVGFDPRGVGESTPVDCAPDAQLDELVAADPDPDNTRELKAVNRLVGSVLEGCLSRDPGLTRHMSTIEAAKDIDVLRAALGEQKLSYFGASYGTFLGGTYADLFPQRVGRMVLDGAIDPSLSSVALSLIQARGFETALRAYVGACVGTGHCYLGGSVDEGLSLIKRFLAALDGKPITGSGDRELTEGLAVLGIWAPLYNKRYWPILDQALGLGLRGAGGALVNLADAYTSRGPSGYTDNSLEALYVVNCLDHDDPLPMADIAAQVPRFEEAAPTWGRIFASGLSGCANWSVHTGRGGTPLEAKGSAPIMVVGTTRDPATPLAWAESVAKQLDNAVLVKRDGDGHTGYHAGNQCVDDAVERYLVSGVVPKATVSC